METQVYKVRDPSGTLREIRGPVGASDDMVIAKAKELFGQVAPNLPSQILTEPGANLQPSAQPERGVMDYVRGIADVPGIVAGGLASGAVAPLAALYGELTSPAKQGTPEARAAGEAMAAKARAQFYQPRTQVGPEMVGAVGQFLEPLTGALPPTLGSTGTALSAASPAALNMLAAQAAPIASRVVAPVRNALAKTPESTMMGGGAANTREELLRAERAQRTGVPLTKGELTQDLMQQRFESETAKTEAGRPLQAFKAEQQKAIQSRFNQMAEETGAEYADPQGYLSVGKVVDKAIVDAYDKKKQKVDAAYQAARDSGETKQLVDTSQLEQWLTDNAPEAISVPQIQTIAAKLDALKKATGNQVSIDDLENIYKSAGSLSKDNPSAGKFMGEVKTIINSMTEGAGGDLYRKARAERAQLGKEFDDAYRVSKLLGTRAGYADRQVALDDVFKHVVLDGSKDELQTVGLVLKKNGQQGRQAWAELQGQTIQHLKDIATKGETQDVQFNQLRNAINALDKEGKLEYMFGKPGRDQVLDLRDVVQDALVKKPGAVNYSQSASFIADKLEKLAKMRIPLASTAADVLEQRATAKKVQEAIKYNALAPESKPQNALVK